MSGRKVGIVGLSSTTHDQAPLRDPEWELWGLPWDEGYWVHYSRLFEMHDKRLLDGAHSQRKAGYFARLREADVPLYMQEQYYQNVTRYPFEDVATSVGDYWNSSIGYMLALAIHEKPNVIGIWGGGYGG